MKWCSSLSQSKNLDLALNECINSITKKLHNISPDFVVVFVSPHFENDYKQIHKTLYETFPNSHLIGCSGGGIIGDGREIENHPALSLTAAVLPGVKVQSFVVQEEDLPDLDASPREWEKLTGVSRQAEPHFIILADPFSISTENFILGMDYAYPQSVKLGGLASAASEPNKNALFLDKKLYHSGLVGIAFSGNILMDSLVAQGCRPIGEPMQITGCEQNILLEVNDRPPLKIFEEIYEQLSERDQTLARHSLFLGISTHADTQSLNRSDFLIRNIMAIDSDQGAIAIGSLLRIGQTVQFFLRDSETSREDLHHVLSQYAKTKNKLTIAETTSKGVFLFSCLGRGSYLYKSTNHDSDLFKNIVGQWPLTGFFCNGEIGPVGKTTFLHGYTSCFGIIHAKQSITEM